MGIYEISLATVVGINIILALGLNMISGFCGQISLGHAAFYGVGAYTAASLSVSGVPFVLSLLAGVVIAGLFGVIIGVAALRVREDFLAITTMGIGFLFLGFVRKQEWLGGEFGIARIPQPMDAEGYAALAIAAAILMLLVSIHVRRSWMGEIFRAIASDEDAAKSIGINTARYKLWAFGLGTASAGLAGGIYAHFYDIIVPDAFDFIQSITILAMVVVGGIGSTAGAVLGAILLTLMPELFRFINDYKLLVYGGLLIVVMRFSPGGVIGLVKLVVRRIR